MPASEPIEEEPVTATLCDWVTSLQATDIPPHVLQRAKHLILDGLACGLVGAHVPWSEKCLDAIDSYEPAGYCSVLDSSKQYGPLAAAILNGAYIQAVELDDYHSAAPLHSASVILPALFAAAEVHSQDSQRQPPPDSPQPPPPHRPRISGRDFLIAAIVGFETGPRAGAAMYGADLLSRGWHSGPIFGCPAAAAAAAKLLGLSCEATESAIGIACTQAGGLMAAQYEGMIKRVQHAFAARNGLFGALLARNGYLGITKVFERPYGGFLAMFSQGNGRQPAYQLDRVTAGLSQVWETMHIRVKLHACVGGCHGQVEAIEQLQRAYPARFARERLGQVRRICVALSEPVFAHDGWAPTVRPLTATGGQMNAAYIGAAQLVYGQVLLEQFEAAALDDDLVWELIRKTECVHSEEFDRPDHLCGARVAVEFADGERVEQTVAMPRGFDPPITDEEIQAKWQKLVQTRGDSHRMQRLEELVLSLEQLEDISDLLALIRG
ncbi:MmgE/PrpD family protein [Aspergillus saccharolyticus JOP 1030-1]|uniref:2-methylcitrate dehydratase PrpD n=1 Tax=Aspergillus saccharolyticus JOP 1030-1 TaxID=1450539 RepID=A0A318ZE07_9EURO|nr:2-methylcitrate dehydratase PrpD [Aspergillus saccharolyticus JOP 1030-1]PYH41780.1 2-methylcitrate dehydratase PrpD [Aspergillus saccharolyticus JOP 1030-1]